jgi:hypothetical protein
VLVGSVTVHVLGARFPAHIACQVGFERLLDVDLGATPPAAIYFASSDSSLLTVTVKQTIGTRVRLGVKPLGLGSPVIEARANGSGQLIASHAVEPFTQRLPAKIAVFRNGYGLGKSQLIMQPLREQVTYHFSIFAGYATFLGGAPSFTIKTSQAASSLGEPGFAPALYRTTGQVVPTFIYTLEIPVDKACYCFSVQGFQDGFAISQEE